MTERKRRLKIPLKVADTLMGELRRRLRINGAKAPCVAVGGVRRRKPFVKDLDMVVVVPSVAAAAPLVTLARSKRAAASISAVASSGGRRCALNVAFAGGSFRVDLFFATKRERPFAVFYGTGNRLYNIRMRAHAKRLGFKLNQYGLWRRDAPGTLAPNAAAVRRERDIAALLGVTYRAPQDRGER